MTSTATANPILNVTANKFMQSANEFVGKVLFPYFYTGEQAAQYYVFDKENALNIPTDIQRAAGAGYSRSLMKLSDDSFYCKEYGHEEPVDDIEKAKYASALDADNSAVNRSTNIIMVNQEIRAHALATSGAVPTSAISTKWDDGASDPFADVNVAREVIHDSCGLDPNTMVISRDVFNVLCEHPLILDKIKHTQRGVTTVDILAMVFKVQRVVVAGVVTNSAAEGQTISPAKIWGDDVILAHTSNDQGLRTPSFGRTFAWTGQTGRNGVMVKSYREEAINSDVHRVSQNVSEKLVGADCGYRLSDALT